MDLTQCMKSFVEIVEQQSFAKAARKLYRSAPQLSKELNWLEQELGVVLIQRTTRKLSITEAGEKFYEYAINNFEELKQIKYQLIAEQNNICGNLKITVPTAYGEEIFLPTIMKFMQAYPEVTIDLQLTNKYVDLVSEKVDIAIYADLDKGSRANCVSTRITQGQRGVFASPAYLKTIDKIERPEQLSDIDCLIHTDLLPPKCWKFKDKVRVFVKPKLQTNSVKGLVEPALLGLGCIFLSRHHVKRYLETGELVEILKPYAETPVDVFISHIKQAVVPKKISTFIEFALNEHKDMCFI